MKKVIYFISLLILFLVTTAFQDTEPAKITLPVIVAIIAGVYEVLARVVPTVTNWSLIGKIVDIIKFISDSLNRKKK